MIRAENLVRTFGSKNAVDGISFSVPAGQIFAFLGPNGAGKTTTVQMLTTLLRPTQGTIAIDDLCPVTQPFEVRRRIGVVFQDPSLDIELTAFENMQLHAMLYGIPRRVRRARIDSLLALFELSDRRNDFVKFFSGGMKRRLEVARGLLHAPKVLFLDEPTLGLDALSRHQLWHQVRHLNEADGVTIFLTTHQIDECERIAHQVAIIQNGRIVAQGRPQELRERSGTTSLEHAFLALTSSTAQQVATPLRKATVVGGIGR
jgi:ABC-2 type transport system ATP-binding protein